MLKGITDDPTERDHFLHYHRILVDSIPPDMFSEVVHTHEFTEKGHSHQVSISRAFKKVEQEV